MMKTLFHKCAVTVMILVTFVWMPWLVYGSTNIPSLTTILLTTNIPTTNFHPSGTKMSVSYQVNTVYVTTFTNAGRVHWHTNREMKAEYIQHFQRHDEWRPTPIVEKLYESPPPLPNMPNRPDPSRFIPDQP